MKEISKILHDDEEVLWEGKPQTTPYMVGVVLSAVPGVIWSLFLIPFIWGGAMAGPGVAWLVVSPFILVALVLLVGVPLYGILLCGHLWYAVTDKRFILQKGVIGRDFESVNHDKIENASVDVGVIDKVFGKNSGTVLVYTTRVVSRGKQGSQSAPFKLRHITDPYGTFDMLKKVSLDVRADIQFPNAMRPEENRGYGAKYRADKKPKGR